MTIEIDTHAHTLVSGHAYNTMREMVQMAAEKGLKGLALTEHAPKMPGSTNLYYFENLGVVPRKMYGIDVRPVSYTHLDVYKRQEYPFNMKLVIYVPCSLLFRGSHLLRVALTLQNWICVRAWNVLRMLYWLFLSQQWLPGSWH